MVKKINTPPTFNTLRMGKAPEVRMVDVSASAPKSLNLFPKKNNRFQRTKPQLTCKFQFNERLA